MEIWHRIFGGLIFGPGISLCFVGSPIDFVWVLIFAPIRSSLSLEIQNTPPGGGGVFISLLGTVNMEVGDSRLGNLPMKGKQVNPGVNLRWGII